MCKNIWKINEHLVEHGGAKYPAKSLELKDKPLLLNVYNLPLLILEFYIKVYFHQDKLAILVNIEDTPTHTKHCQYFSTLATDGNKGMNAYQHVYLCVLNIQKYHTVACKQAGKHVAHCFVCPLHPSTAFPPTIFAQK